MPHSLVFLNGESFANRLLDVVGRRKDVFGWFNDLRLWRAESLVISADKRVLERSRRVFEEGYAVRAGSQVVVRECWRTVLSQLGWLQKGLPGRSRIDGGERHSLARRSQGKQRSKKKPKGAASRLFSRISSGRVGMPQSKLGSRSASGETWTRREALRVVRSW
jgi:hypothetical protein